MGRNYCYRLSEKGTKAALMFPLFYKRVSVPLANSLSPSRKCRPLSCSTPQVPNVTKASGTLLDVRKSVSRIPLASPRRFPFRNLESPAFVRFNHGSLYNQIALMTSATLARPVQSHFRWTICALLFFATTINYLDRQVLSILAKTLETDVGWSSTGYGYITAAFQAAYAVGLLGAGRLMDRLGIKRGYGIAIVVWSVAAMAHAASTTRPILAIVRVVFSGLVRLGFFSPASAASTVLLATVAFSIARFALGLGESANFPACIKSVAEWFPKKERALATGIFNSGTNVGAIFAPLTVPWLAVTLGWQAAFIATGALGFLWLAFWLAIYGRPEEHSSVSVRELDAIRSDPPDKFTSVPWVRLLPKRETWSFAVGKFLTDPIWWFYLFWFPKFMQETFGLSLQQIVVPTLVVYNVSAVGSIIGGWLPLELIRRGWNANAARKTAMLACALAVVPVLYAPYCRNQWIVVGLVGLATAAHQGWSANLFTTVSDTFPRAAVGSVVGIGGTIGSIGGVLMSIFTGLIVDRTHSYLILFLIAGSAYLVALAAVHILSPRLAPAKLE